MNQFGKESVYIVLNDLAVSDQIASMMLERDREPHILDSSDALLANIGQPLGRNPRCLVTEFQLPTLGGLAMQNELQKRNIFLPIVFYVDRPCITDTVRAIRNGAIDVIERVAGHSTAIPGVNRALDNYRISWPSEARRRDTMEQLQSLNDGEQQVLDGILRGMMNKEIARSLNLSIRTIEQRRRQIFRKLHVQHPAELAQRVLDATNASIDDTIKDHSQPLRSHFVSVGLTAHAMPIMN